MKMLRTIRKERGMTMKALGEKVGVSESAISQYETGKREADFETLLKLSEILECSVDYLLRGDAENNFSSLESTRPLPSANGLTEKDKRDIAKDLEQMMSSLENGSGLMFDGDPLSDEAKASIMSAMQLGLEAAKAKNKERFTPKKYRKE